MDSYAEVLDGTGLVGIYSLYICNESEFLPIFQLANATLCSHIGYYMITNFEIRYF